MRVDKLLTFSFGENSHFFKKNEIIETPQAVPESENTRDFAVIRMEGEFGVASGFFVDQDKIATNIHVVAYPGVIFARSSDQKTIWRVEGITGYDVKNNLVILKVSGIYSGKYRESQTII